jgi:hypothetical protein
LEKIKKILSVAYDHQKGAIGNISVKQRTPLQAAGYLLKIKPQYFLSYGYTI